MQLTTEGALEGSVKTLDAEAMNPSREDVKMVEAKERKRERTVKATADTKAT